MSDNYSTKPHVKVSGSGPNLVLLHGWGLHGGIWNTVVAELERSFTIHNVDLPGFGQSRLCGSGYTLDYLVESVASILPTKCFLLGWSLGGVVATEIAKRFPAKISKLVTVASSPLFVTNNDWPFAMDKQVLESFIDFLEKDFRGTLIKFLSIQTMGSKTQKQDIAQLKETVFAYGIPDEKALRGGLQILNDVDLRNDLTDLAMPMLRLYGRLDTLVPVKSVPLVDDYAPHSSSIIFKKSGHAPFLSEGDEFIRTLTQFLVANAQENQI